MTDSLRFRLNGREVVASGVAPTTTLLNYLRRHLRKTGTKEGCAEGDCGACTVAVLDADAPQGPTWRAVNSCLVLLPMVQGKDVVTVEGLQDPASGDWHPAQRALVEALGSQCGYCTPGIVMAMFEACYRKDLDAPWKLEDQLCGNLCRCTGYRPIREATAQVAGLCPKDRFAEALDGAAPRSMALRYAHDHQRYFNPTTTGDLFDLLDAHPDARFVVGGTDLSLEVTKQFKEPELLISLEGIAELRGVTVEEDAWVVGACTPLSDLEDACSQGAFAPLARMLRFFGARQIKNRGTVGGNLCTASPIGDLAPVLISLDAEAVILGRAGRRTVPLDAFFPAYRTTALQTGEVLAAVRIPLLEDDAPGVRAGAYKVSKRQELDISAVSAGMVVHLNPDNTVARARIAFGGMAATPARARALEAALQGAAWTEDSVEAALPALDQDFTPIDDHRGSAWYRGTVARNLVRGFFAETANTSTPRLPYKPTGTVQPEATTP